MIIDEIYDRLLDLFRPKAITIPPMDGHLLPNNLLEEAPVAVEVHQPDNAINCNGELLFSSGNRVLRFDVRGDQGESETVREFDHEITCMAAGSAGQYAVGLNSGQIFVEGAAENIEISSVGDQELKCPTAMQFVDEHQLVVCQGSTQVSPSDMRVDLMNIGRSGSVWKLNLRDGSQECLASDLGYPYGVAALPGTQEILISECWRHRVVKLSLDSTYSVKSVISDLQGYPARLFETSNGKIMLCIFAARNRLVEFVLKEDEFRQRMIESVDPQFWIAPQLRTGESFLEPLQQGRVKTMNILKPWAPSLSYGLVVRLGKNGNPEASYHSRANGSRHGITSGCEIDGHVYVTSKGGDCILKIEQDD